MSAAELTENEIKQQEAKQEKEEQLQIPDVLPVLPLRDLVTFPYMIVPVLISREKAIRAVDQTLAQNRMIFLTTQRDQETEDPGPKDVYEIGTVAIVIRMLKMPDQRVRILVEGIARARALSWQEDLPYLQAKIQVLEEKPNEIPALEAGGLATECQGSPRESGFAWKEHPSRGHDYRRQYG